MARSSGRRPSADARRARALAMQGVAAAASLGDRAEPVRSANLFAIGVAARPGQKANLLLRALYAVPTAICGPTFVPAALPTLAGLRSGDVIETIDGVAWWLYGTYQSEQRAYDGKPHAFEVLRGRPSRRAAARRAFSGMNPTDALWFAREGLRGVSPVLSAWSDRRCARGLRRSARADDCGRRRGNRNLRASLRGARRSP